MLTERRVSGSLAMPSLVTRAIDVERNYKDAVRFVATSGTFATDFDNGSTVDGIVVATGDRFLYQPQTGRVSTSGPTVGVYVAAASGVPTRAPDFDEGSDFPRAAIMVREGTVFAGSQWTCINVSPPTLGISSITFREYRSSGTSSSYRGRPIDVVLGDIIDIRDYSLYGAADDFDYGLLTSNGANNYTALMQAISEAGTIATIHLNGRRRVAGLLSTTKFISLVGETEHDTHLIFEGSGGIDIDCSAAPVAEFGVTLANMTVASLDRELYTGIKVKGLATDTGGQAPRLIMDSINFLGADRQYKNLVWDGETLPQQKGWKKPFELDSCDRAVLTNLWGRGKNTALADAYDTDTTLGTIRDSTGVELVNVRGQRFKKAIYYTGQSEGLLVDACAFAANERGIVAEDLITPSNANTIRDTHIASDLCNIDIGQAISSKVVTHTVGTPGIVNRVAHGLVAAEQVRFTVAAGGTLAAPFVAGTYYFVLAAGLTANAFEVSATDGGAAINTSSAGTGVQSMLSLAGGTQLWNIIGNPLLQRSTGVAGGLAGFRHIRACINEGSIIGNKLNSSGFPGKTKGNAGIELIGPNRKVQVIGNTGTDCGVLYKQSRNDGTSSACMVIGNTAHGSIEPCVLTASRYNTVLGDIYVGNTELGTQTVLTGTAQAGSASTVRLPVGFVAATDYYVGLRVRLLTNTGFGQTRPIIAFDASTGDATVSPNFGTAPDNTTTLIVELYANPGISQNSASSHEFNVGVGRSVQVVAAAIADIRLRLTAQSKAYGRYVIGAQDAANVDVPIEFTNDIWRAGELLLTSKHAGWGDPTGTLVRTTFDTTTVTLPQLASRVAQLILDLKAGQLPKT